MPSRRLQSDRRRSVGGVLSVRPQTKSSQIKPTSNPLHLPQSSGLAAAAAASRCVVQTPPLTAPAFAPHRSSRVEKAIFAKTLKIFLEFLKGI